MNNTFVGMGLFWTTEAEHRAAEQGWALNVRLDGDCERFDVVSLRPGFCHEDMLDRVKRQAVSGCFVSCMALAFVNAGSVSFPDDGSVSEMVSSALFDSGSNHDPTAH